MQLLTISPSRTEVEVDMQRVPLLTDDVPRCYQRIIAGHALRTSKLARTLAHKMQCTEEVAHLMALAALMHDIGKIDIPANILDKPGRLTEQEWSVIRCHPQIG